VTYFISGVLFNDFLQNSVNFQSAALFCSFLETDLSFLCLDPVAQLFHHLSPYPFVCDQIAAAGLSFTLRFLSNTSPAVQLLCLSVFRELPESVLETAPFPEIFPIVSDLLPDSAVFSFLTQMLAVIPHCVWVHILALPPAALLSVSDVVEFCEFWEAIAAFETKNEGVSLLQSAADQLVRILFEIVAVHTDGETAFEDEDAELPNAIAVRALREIVGFATPSVSVELIQVNWSEIPQRREAAMALLGLSAENLIIKELPLEELIAEGLVDSSIRVRQNALYCVEMLAGLRGTITHVILELVLGHLQDPVLAVDAIDVLGEISGFINFEPIARELFESLIVCDNDLLINAITRYEITIIPDASETFKDEMLLICMRIDRSGVIGFHICSIFEVLLGNFPVIAGERAVALTEFFANVKPIDVDLLFPWINFQLHCTEEFLNFDPLIGLILNLLVNPEHIRLAANAILMLQTKYNLDQFAEAIGIASYSIFTSTCLLQSDKQNLYETITNFGGLFSEQLGETLRIALVSECENLENCRDIEVISKMLICLITLAWNYPPHDSSQSLTDGAFRLLFLIAYSSTLPENASDITSVIMMLNQLFPEQFSEICQSIQNSPLFLALSI
jgi:hypothetical protein